MVDLGTDESKVDQKKKLYGRYDCKGTLQLLIDRVSPFGYGEEGVKDCTDYEFVENLNSSVSSRYLYLR